VSQGGARYRLIYLNPKSARMTLPVLRKLVDFAEAGATIVGEAPQSSPSLKDDAGEFARLVQRLWSGGAVTQVGRGRVFSGRNVEQALEQIGVAPDIDAGSLSGTDLQFVHRALEDGEFYFVSNRKPEAVRAEVRFRAAGKAPELWHADTGGSERVSYRVEGAQTIVPLDLRAHQSVFVVFRGNAAAPFANVARPAWRQVGEIGGAWDVAFQARRGAPAAAQLPALVSLTESSDAGVKYFSGVATYSRTFDLPSGVQRGEPLWLDLGAVGDLAEVRVNGRMAGAAWKPPYRIEISAFVRQGGNRLEVRVANKWVNRLIGDQQPGAAKVAFTTFPTFTQAAPLQPSGLIGPVTLWRPDA
jgi:alpha-L-rhamnosidase